MRNDALYLTVLNAAGADVRQHTEDAEVISLDAFLAREERQRFVSICLVLSSMT